jgi:hypothetical protein
MSYFAIGTLLHLAPNYGMTVWRKENMQLNDYTAIGIDFVDRSLRVG